MEWPRAVLRRTGEPAGATVLGLAITALLVPLLESLHGPTGQLGQSIPLLFLLPVVATSLLGGWIPGTLVATVALFAWDWFFIPPFYRVTVASARDAVALAVFLGVALLTGQLATSLRRRIQNEARRASAAEAMHALSSALIARRDVAETLLPITHCVRETFDLEACAVLLPGDATSWRTASIAGRIPDRYRVELSRSIAACASWATGSREMQAGISSDLPNQGPALDDGRVRFLALRTTAPGGGVLELVLKPGASLAEPDERLLTTLANGIAVALEQERLAEQERAGEIARESDRLKSVLLSSVSHDLRTPLAGIKAAVTSLLQKDVRWTEEDREAFLADIDAEVDRVSRLVSNILDASRIEAGVLRPNRDWEYVRELVLRAVREANRHGHEVRTDFPDKLPLLWIDAVKIEQVVTNLIENAGQYSPPGSVIHVDVTVADTVLEIGVADQGPGIPAHLRDRVFDKFFRVAGTRGSVGTGMGLAIVKGFTEAHGGTVRVEEAPGGGARFVVSLPLAGPERDMSATTITEGIEDGEHIDVAPTPRLPKP